MRSGAGGRARSGHDTVSGAALERPPELSRRGLVMIAAALGLLGMACHEPPATEFPTERVGPDFRKLRRRIRKHVQSRERRKAALALVGQIEKQLGDVDRLLVEWRTDLALLPDDQRWDRAMTLEVTRNNSERVGEVAREVGRSAYQLRSHITADEWPLVFPSSSLAVEREGPC